MQSNRLYVRKEFLSFIMFVLARGGGANRYQYYMLCLEMHDIEIDQFLPLKKIGSMSIFGLSGQTDRQPLMRIKFSHFP